MISVVTFDFWGTLYQDVSGRDARLNVLAEALSQYGQPRQWADLEKAHQLAWSTWKRVWMEEHRSITTEDWLLQMLAFPDAELPESARADLRQPIEEVYLKGNELRPVPGVADVLPRLARRYRLGLISDVGLTPGRVLREILRRDSLLPFFKALTFSDETGATKPLPKQFLHTLDLLEARPEEAVHIGDLPETDLAGARGVGIKAVLFLAESHRDDGLPMAHASFEAYEELEQLLESLE
jgi:putative hydrolase of the HAD superfamily